MEVSSKGVRGFKEIHWRQFCLKISKGLIGIRSLKMGFILKGIRLVKSVEDLVLGHSHSKLISLINVCVLQIINEKMSPDNSL